eukprot:6993002-Prymnesium_polylepis.2
MQSARSAPSTSASTSSAEAPDATRNSSSSPSLILCTDLSVYPPRPICSLTTAGLSLPDATRCVGQKPVASCSACATSSAAIEPHESPTKTHGPFRRCCTCARSASVIGAQKASIDVACGSAARASRPAGCTK